MIKPENLGKIPEIYRKNPLKTLKICRRMGGVRLRRTGGFLPIFFDDRGVLADPPFGHAWFTCMKCNY